MRQPDEWKVRSGGKGHMGGEAIVETWNFNEQQLCKYVIMKHILT